MKQIFIIFSAVLLLASCGTTRKTQTTPVPTTEETETPVDSLETMSTVLSKLNHIDYTTFSGKMDASYKDSKNKDYNFDVKLNMKKDELIWLSITGPLGIEAARALVTRDSVKILNKLEKKYIVSSIDYLQQQLGLPLDLNTLQDLLIGNAVFIDKTSSSYVKEGENIVISSQTRFFRNLLTLNMPGYLPGLSKLEDVDAERNRTAELSYSDYKEIDGRNFSAVRAIKVNQKTTIDINLNYKSHTFNGDISTPFSVPSGYKRVIR